LIDAIDENGDYGPLNGSRGLSKSIQIVLRITRSKSMVAAMVKRLITLSFFLLAFVLYFLGMTLPAAIFLLLGAVAVSTKRLSLTCRKRSGKNSAWNLMRTGCSPNLVVVNRNDLMVDIRFE